MTAAIPSVPKAFISYAWENDRHKAWVRDLATKLRTDGIDVTLDQWQLVLGDQLPEFMERSVRESDFVLIICTPTYKAKSDTRTGGVGYEGHIITAEVFNSQNHRKFIPILRSDEWKEAAPSWISGKLYADLRGDQYSEVNYKALLDTLHRMTPQPPYLGTSLYKPDVQPASPFDDQVVVIPTPQSSREPRLPIDISQFTDRVAALEGERWQREEQQKVQIEKASALLEEFRDTLSGVAAAVEAITRNPVQLYRDTGQLNAFKKWTIASAPYPVFQGDLTVAGFMSGVHIYAGVEAYLWANGRVRLWGVYGVGGQSVPITVLFDKVWDHTEEITLDAAEVAAIMQRMKEGFHANLKVALERFVTEREQLRAKGIKTFRYINPKTGELVARIQAHQLTLATELFRACALQGKVVVYPGFISGEPTPTALEFHLSAVPDEDRISTEEEQY